MISRSDRPTGPDVIVVTDPYATPLAGQDGGGPSNTESWCVPHPQEAERMTITVRGPIVMEQSALVTLAKTPLEERSEVDSLDALHAQRRQLLPQYAALKALHGPNGKWDNRRKQMLEAIKVRVRNDLRTSGEKSTEAQIDALAHGDDQYVELIDKGIEAATTYVELDIKVSEIEERIRGREIALLSYNSELKLAR